MFSREFCEALLTPSYEHQQIVSLILDIKNFRKLLGKHLLQRLFLQDIPTAATVLSLEDELRIKAMNRLSLWLFLKHRNFQKSFGIQVK